MPRPKKSPPTDGLMNVSASLPAELVARIDAHAELEQRSRSNAIAVLLARALGAEQPRQAG